MRPRRPHPRIRRAIKWGGLVVTTLLVVVWIGSTRWMFKYDGKYGDGFVVSGGMLRTIHSPGLRREAGPASWYAGRWRARLEWGSESVVHLGFRVVVPLWPLPLLAFLITAAAWRCDFIARRRARKGLCPACRYDRAGIAPDAPCPECGTKPVTP